MMTEDPDVITVRMFIEELDDAIDVFRKLEKNFPYPVYTLRFNKMRMWHITRLRDTK